MKKLTAFGAALAAAVLSFSSFGRTFVVSDQATFEAALRDASEEGGDELVINEDTITLNTTMIVNKPVVVRGAGLREDTTLKITVKKIPVIEVNDENAVLKNVTITGSNVGYLEKGGLKLTSGLVTNVIIRDNIASGTYAGPAGVNMTGGRLTGSLIYNNTGGHAKPGVIDVSGNLDNLVAGKGPEIDHCIITGNKMVDATSSCNGMVGLGLAYMHDCLIANNVCEKGDTAGVKITSYGVLANCTIANNSSGAALAGGLFWANQNLARVVNCIVAGNTCTGGNCDWGKTNNTKDSDLPNVFLNCLFDGSDIGGTNCQVGDPGFNDPANGDFSITAASAKARDLGLTTWKGLNNKKTFTILATDRDFAGNDRIMGTTVDIGAYEFDPNQFSASFSCETLSGSTETTFNFHAEVTGTSGNVSYLWMFTNDLTGESTESTEVEPAFTAPKAGTYTVSLRVTDDSHDKTVTKSAFISALSLVTFADPDSATPAYPYNTAATAAKTLQEAYDACANGGTVTLAEKTFTLPAKFMIDRPVTVRGAGAREATVLTLPSSVMGTAVCVNHADAVLKNVTIADVTVSEINTGALNIGSGGTVTNCVIRDNKTKKDTIRIGPAAVYMMGGRLTGSLVTGNTSCHDSAGSVKVAAESAVVDHCRIVDNTVAAAKSTYGALVLEKGLVEDTVIANNTCDAGNAAGVKLDGGPGTLRNCTITGNNAGSGGQAGGIFWNRQCTYSVVNCIVAGNRSAAGAVDLYIADAGVRNTDPALMFHNCAFDGSTNLLNNSNILIDTAKGETAGFLDPDNGDYSLTASSPCIDKGTEATALGGRTIPELLQFDFVGNDRVMGVTVDVGAYEYDPSQMSCDFTTPVAQGFLGQTFALTPVVEGASGALTYAWTIRCGDTVIESAEESPSVTPPTYGKYDVTLAVTGDAGTKEITKAGFLTVGSHDIYLTAGASAPKYPFASAEAATASAKDAVDAAIDGSTVHVTGLCTIEEILMVDKAILIEGTTATVLCAPVDGIKQTAKMRVVQLNNAGVKLKNLKITGGVDADQYYHGGGIYVMVNGGTVEDCLIVDNKIGHYGSGGGVYVMQDATNVFFRRCVFRGNYGVSGSYGGAVNAYAGVFENCLFDGNYLDNGWGNAICLSDKNVQIVNCTIVGSHGVNSGDLATKGANGAIFFSSASVAEPGLQIVNCLFDGNYLKTADQVSNWSAHPTADADGIAAAFTTCAFTAGELPVADDETKAMLVADPGFTGDGTYRLTKRSALRDQGTYENWMEGATDLYGAPRCSLPKKVAVGCCEPAKVYGFQILVR